MRLLVAEERQETEAYIDGCVHHLDLESSGYKCLNLLETWNFLSGIFNAVVSVSLSSCKAWNVAVLLVILPNKDVGAVLRICNIQGLFDCSDESIHTLGIFLRLTLVPNQIDSHSSS